MKINFVIQNNSVEDILKGSVVGDILFGSRYLIKTAGFDFHAYPLNSFGNNNWKVLESMGINTSRIKSSAKYVCPFRGSKIEFYGLYPFAISAVCDKFVARYSCIKQKNFTQLDFTTLSNIEMCFLGHGYTSGNLPDDGHGYVKTFMTALDDGRTVYYYGHVWYNK